MIFDHDGSLCYAKPQFPVRLLYGTVRPTRYEYKNKVATKFLFQSKKKNSAVTSTLSYSVHHVQYKFKYTTKQSTNFE